MEQFTSNIVSKLCMISFLNLIYFYFDENISEMHVQYIAYIFPAVDYCLAEVTLVVLCDSKFPHPLPLVRPPFTPYG